MGRLKDKRVSMIPLVLRKTIEKMVTNKSLITIEFEKDDFPFPLTINDNHSDWYAFIINSHTKNSDVNSTEIMVNIEYAPSSIHSIEWNETRVSYRDLPKIYQQWRDLVNAHNRESPLFDDSILNHYYEELEPYFQIIDKNADKVPFNRSQQKLLEKYYTGLIKAVEDYPDMIKEEREELISDLTRARNEIPKSTKTKVVDTIRKVATKLWKYVPEIFDRTVVRLGSDLLKGVIKGDIDPTIFLPGS